MSQFHDGSIQIRPAQVVKVCEKKMVSIPRWLNSNLLFEAQAKEINVLSQFHDGSIQIGRNTATRKGMNHKSQFHDGSIQIIPIGIGMNIKTYGLNSTMAQFKWGKHQRRIIKVYMVSIPRWLNSNTLHESCVRQEETSLNSTMAQFKWGFRSPGEKLKLCLNSTMAQFK